MRLLKLAELRVDRLKVSEEPPPVEVDGLERLHLDIFSG